MCERNITIKSRKENKIIYLCFPIASNEQSEYEIDNRNTSLPEITEFTEREEEIITGLFEIYYRYKTIPRK